MIMRFRYYYSNEKCFYGLHSPGVKKKICMLSTGDIGIEMEKQNKMHINDWNFLVENVLFIEYNWINLNI